MSRIRRIVKISAASRIADPDYEYNPDSGYAVSFPRENWLPIIPSFGVSYEF